MKRAIAGGRSDHGKGAVYAEEDNGQLHFATLLRSGSLSGQVVMVVAPVLKPSQIDYLVRKRMADFMGRPGARESPAGAVVRKSIAAQGSLSVGRARRLMTKMAAMELDMMLSKDSHMQALPFEQGQGKPVVRMTAAGEVTGLHDPLLLDQHGTRYRVKP